MTQPLELVRYASTSPVQGSNQAVAEGLGIDPSAVSLIRSGKRWGRSTADLRGVA